MLGQAIDYYHSTAHVVVRPRRRGSDKEKVSEFVECVESILCEVIFVFDLH